MHVSQLLKFLTTLTQSERLGCPLPPPSQSTSYTRKDGVCVKYPNDLAYCRTVSSLLCGRRHNCSWRFFLDWVSNISGSAWISRYNMERNTASWNMDSISLSWLKMVGSWSVLPLGMTNLSTSRKKTKKDGSAPWKGWRSART